MRKSFFKTILELCCTSIKDSKNTKEAKENYHFIILQFLG